MRSAGVGSLILARFPSLHNGPPLTGDRVLPEQRTLLELGAGGRCQYRQGLVCFAAGAARFGANTGERGCWLDSQSREASTPIRSQYLGRAPRLTKPGWPLAMAMARPENQRGLNEARMYQSRKID